MTVKKGDTTLVVTPEDVLAWMIGGVGLIAGLTFSLLLLAGKVNEAGWSFSFLLGLGFSESIRHILAKNTSQKKES